MGFGIAGRANRVWGSPWLWLADFSRLPVGGMSAADLLAATGVMFTRASGTTVQTSASSLIEGLGVDVAAIGSPDGARRGLVIQQRVQNIIPGAGGDAPRNLQNAQYLIGSGVSVGAQLASPDQHGTGGSRATVASGQFSNYLNFGSSAPRCFSAWVRSVDASAAGEPQIVFTASVPPNGGAAFAAASNTWRRVALSAASLGSFTAVSDGRDWTGGTPAGQTARARDVFCDYMQVESGLYPNEAIPLGLGICAAPRVVAPGIARGLVGGRLRFYARWIPKWSTSEAVYFMNTTTSFKGTLWWSSGTARAVINSTNQLQGLIDGIDLTAAVPFVWSRGDDGEIIIEAGAGAPSARVAVNGGAWVDLGLPATPQAALPAVGDLFFYDSSVAVESNNSRQFPGWLVAVGALAPDA